jgi:peptidoglycan/LPS O-acetylase OafA/YrhL
VAASTAVTLEDTPGRASTSTRTAQVAALTGLRGFAALMVVLVHVAGRTEYTWLGIPSYGPVSLFVLSGYLLYRPWARWGMRIAGRPSLRVFTRRRLARIFPAYLVVLFAIAIIYPDSRPDTAGGWVRAITLTWIYESGELPDALLQTWSLATELSWYVALPVMAGITTAVARSRSPRVGFWVSAAMISLALPITVAWRWWVHAENLEIYFTYSFWLPGFLVCFAGGALVAHFAEGYRCGLVSLPRLRSLASDPWALILFALAVALLGTSSLGGPSGYVVRGVAQQQLRFACATVIALTLLVIVVMGTRDSPLSRILSTTWFNAVGRWSYGIYLWHLPLIVMTEKGMTFPEGLAGLVLRLLWILGLSIALGAATYRVVEQPAIRWSQRRPIQAPTPTPPEQDQRDLRNPRDVRERDLSGNSEARTPSSTTSAQPTAPNRTQPRRLPPGE